MDETLMKLRILAKAESTLFKANARRASTQARLFALAIGLLLLTVVMVNIALYQYFSETQTPATAAVWVAGINAALAVVAIIAALRVKPGPEEAMVQDIREMALAELSADLDVARGEFNQVVEDLAKIKSGVSSAVGMFRSGGPGLGSVGPALGLITGMLGRR